MQALNNHIINSQHQAPSDQNRTTEVNLAKHQPSLICNSCVSIKDRLVYLFNLKEPFSYEDIQDIISLESETIAAKKLEAKLTSLNYYRYKQFLFDKIDFSRCGYYYKSSVIKYFINENKLILAKKLVDIMEAKYVQKFGENKKCYHWLNNSEGKKYGRFIIQIIVPICIHLQDKLHYLEPYLIRYPNEISYIFEKAIKYKNTALVRNLIHIVKIISQTHSFCHINFCYLISTATRDAKSLDIVKQLIDFIYPDKNIPQQYLQRAAESNNYMIIKQFIANNKVCWDEIDMYDELNNKKISLINSCIINNFTDAIFTIISYGGYNPKIILNSPANYYKNFLPPIFWAVYKQDFILIDTLLALIGSRYSLDVILKYLQFTNFKYNQATLKKIKSKVNNPVSLQKIAAANTGKFLSAYINTDTSFTIEDLKSKLYFLPPNWVNNIKSIKDLFTIGSENYTNS